MYESSAWIRVGGTCGIAFLILFLISAVTGGPPLDISASGKDVAAYYGGGGTRIATIAVLLVAPLAPWFFTALTLVLWTRPSGRAYAAIGLVAAALFVAVSMTDFLVRLTLVYGQIDENTARAFNVARFAFGIGVRLMTLAAALAYGVAQARMPGLWRWAGYLALLVALVQAIAALNSLGNGIAGPVALFGALAFLIWVALTGVLLVWQGPEMAQRPVD